VCAPVDVQGLIGALTAGERNALTGFLAKLEQALT